jgi:hypothetical protein
MIISFGASVLITGCGEEDITDPEEEMDEPEETVMDKGPPFDGQLSVTPAPGVIISSSQEFTLAFDIAVMEVIVNGISATDTKAGGFGGVWIVSLTLEPGARDLAVEWTEKSNGCVWVQAVGPYTVVADED